MIEPRTEDEGRTPDNGRTKHQEPRTKDDERSAAYYTEMKNALIWKDLSIFTWMFEKSLRVLMLD
jgi:hypothetical protein